MLWLGLIHMSPVSTCVKWICPLYFQATSKSNQELNSSISSISITFKYSVKQKYSAQLDRMGNIFFLPNFKLASKKLN